MADPATNQAILIRVRNAGELARSQGAVASLAQSLAPATIEAKVYSEMQKKLASSLKDQNVDADVSIVEANKFQPANGSSHIATDVAIGVGILGVLAILWRVATWGSK